MLLSVHGPFCYYTGARTKTNLDLEISISTVQIHHHSNGIYQENRYQSKRYLESRKVPSPYSPSEPIKR